MDARRASPHHSDPQFTGGTHAEDIMTNIVHIRRGGRVWATLAVAAALSGAITTTGVAQGAPPGHRSVRLSEIAWEGKASALQSAVLEGNPDTAGSSYTLALKLADGFWIQPHFHPNPKKIVVLSGVLLMGMGDSVVARRTEALPVGAFSIVSPNAHHYEGGKGETVILLYGVGPLLTTYVDARGAPKKP